MVKSWAGGLTLSSDGKTLYGTTVWGGAYGDGTVFSIATSGGNPKILCSFSGNNGKYPYAGLTLNGSRLYGTTDYGGVYGDGTVFSIATSGGNPTTLCSFNGSSSNGDYPLAGVTLNGSTIYGTTWQVGENGYGTVFALNIAPATIGVSNASSATTITGGTATLGMTLSNSPTSGYNLNYTLGAAVASGSAARGA